MFEFEGKVYDRVPDTSACDGCAFQRPSPRAEQTAGCKASPDCVNHIFVERKDPAAAVTWPNPVTWIDVPNGVPGQVTRVADEHEALTFHELPVDSKPTNPKDVVGIRKAPMSTVSGPVIAELGVAMLEGAAKYGRHNYRVVGVRSSVYYDALFRHIQAWWEGEDIDPDSGMHHVTKAIATLVVLRDAMIQGKCEDDRPPRSVEFFSNLNNLAGEILDRHAGKSPRHYTIQDTV